LNFAIINAVSPIRVIFATKSTAMIRSITLIAAFFAAFGPIRAQSTAFVFNFGPSAGLQKWDNSQGREPLFQYHASVALETINNEDDRASFVMQLGYHVKGSATRFRYFNINSGFPGGTYTERFKFNNISLMLGAKQRYDFGNAGTAKYFYFGGLRGDYTLNTNVDNLPNASNNCNPAAYPLMGGVQRWMVGFSVGGGMEFAFSELVGAQLQLSVNPDVTPQYRQNAIPNVIDICNPGTIYSIPERRIRNTTVELSLGLRLLRKVIIVE
jgi:opacity protein-like surface antigen